MKPTSTTTAAADRKITLTTKLDAAENSFEVILYPDGAMAFTRDHAESFVYLYRDQKQALKKILRIPEAQQTDDTLSELRTKIEARRKMWNDAAPRYGRLHSTEANITIITLDWVLNLIDSAKAAKKEGD